MAILLAAMTSVLLYGISRYRTRLIKKKQHHQAIWSGYHAQLVQEGRSTECCRCSKCVPERTIRPEQVRISANYAS